jgi:hypothetical protein
MAEGAMDQRIRRWAWGQQLVPKKRKGLWYFADFNNILCSPETGLSSEEALEFLDE